SYGLAPPSSQITLRSSPGQTNSTLAVLEIGAFRDNQIFARVPGEESVYALNPAHVLELPTESWQLRDRTLWSFEPQHVSAISVHDQDLDWSIRHVAPNQWEIPAGWRDEINPFALEEAVYQLGHARVLSWIDQ